MNLYDHPEFRDHEQVTFFHDKRSGLKAINAIHSTVMGSVSGGGIRMYDYATDEEALRDVLRLSRGMTYKSALAGIPLGGAKTVIIGNPATDKTPELWKAMANAINGLGGRYVAGEDVGTNSSDLDQIGQHTKWAVTSASPNTAPYTALGVYFAIRTAVRIKLGRDTLEGVSVALQGLGKVAYNLASLLLKDGAVVYGADINTQALDDAVSLGVKPVGVDEIAYLDVDVFSPCAMGAILDQNSIPRLRAKVVCGSANNQLATEDDDTRIQSHGILFIPDFLASAGGVIAGACTKMEGITDSEELSKRVKRIAHTTEQTILLAKEGNIGTTLAANSLAEQIIAKNKADS